MQKIMEKKKLRGTTNTIYPSNSNKRKKGEKTKPQQRTKNFLFVSQ